MRIYIIRGQIVEGVGKRRVRENIPAEVVTELSS